MGIVNTVKCDLCGKMKKEVNNWWIILNKDNIIIIRPMIELDVTSSVKSIGEKTFYCGKSCLFSSLSLELDKIS
jgi:hypothetical protein